MRQSVRNGESQSGSAHVRRGIQLRKRLEEQSLVFSADAGTRIGDTEQQLRGPSTGAGRRQRRRCIGVRGLRKRTRRIVNGNGNNNVSGAGKLEGIILTRK